jgi:CheY-like chemotaxis protein
LEKLLRLKFTNVLSTKEAVAEIEPDLQKYCLVISDMGRPGDPRAGYTLLEKLRAMKYDKPYIIYSSSSGRPEHDKEARDRGAEGSVNNPQKLVDLVRKALERRNG